MTNEIYTVLNNKGEKEGKVYLTESNNLEGHFHDEIVLFRSIEGLFVYLQENKYTLYDMKTDLYTREIHEVAVNMITKIGCGYCFR